ERRVHARGALEDRGVGRDAQVAVPHDGRDGGAELAQRVDRHADRLGEDQAVGAERLHACAHPRAGRAAAEHMERFAIVYECGDVAGADERAVDPPLDVPPARASDHRDAHALAAPGRGGARRLALSSHRSYSRDTETLVYIRHGTRPWWRAAARPR